MFSQIAVTGDYVLSTNYCTQGAKPGTHCNIFIAFKPSAIGVMKRHGHLYRQRKQQPSNSDAGRHRNSTYYYGSSYTNKSQFLDPKPGND
jgi:hypothetical protein